MSLEKIIKNTKEILIERDGEQCQKCKRTKHLTIDHIIPSSLLLQFGISLKESFDFLDNLELLCRACNALKRDRINWLHEKSKDILIKLINKM